MREPCIPVGSEARRRTIKRLGLRVEGNVRSSKMVRVRVNVGGDIRVAVMEDVSMESVRAWVSREFGEEVAMKPMVAAVEDVRVLRDDGDVQRAVKEKKHKKFLAFRIKGAKKGSIAMSQPSAVPPMVYRRLERFEKTMSEGMRSKWQAFRDAAENTGETGKVSLLVPSLLPVALRLGRSIEDPKEQLRCEIFQSALMEVRLAIRNVQLSEESRKCLMKLVRFALRRPNCRRALKTLAYGLDTRAARARALAKDQASKAPFPSDISKMMAEYLGAAEPSISSSAATDWHELAKGFGTNVGARAFEKPGDVQAIRGLLKKIREIDSKESPTEVRGILPLVVRRAAVQSADVSVGMDWLVALAKGEEGVVPPVKRPKHADDGSKDLPPIQTINISEGPEGGPSGA